MLEITTHLPLPPAYTRKKRWTHDMTSSFWLTASQTVVFLAVCGVAWWASRLLAEAADSSAQAAEQALKAANDTERTAMDIREMRDMLRTWLDQQQAQVGRLLEEQMQDAPASTRPVRTDAAEAQDVMTPQAIIGRSDSGDSAEKQLRDAPRSGRGRHPLETGLRRTSAFLAPSSRTASRIKSPASRSAVRLRRLRLSSD